MLPLFWIGAAVASAFVGKKIYDSVTEKDDDYSFEKKEQSDSEIQYNNLLNAYKENFKSKKIELATSSYTDACKNSTKPFIVFAKSQELDDIDEQIYSLENNIEQLKEIQNQLKTKLEEIS
ncbi:V-type ATPase 116kDa subunit family protein [Campylobacter lari]|uniref:V-type ATPase 116kDa subunit family protein n=1 Tax=Campylobacter lari TaxID=201 RepID=A0A7U8AQF8_CAMLA|nr:V-type ATPase 116kDa subunit family protein [Campylobacter lari]